MPDYPPLLPQDPSFHARPKKILSAVEALPEPKGKNRKQSIMLDKLREKLLQISIKDVSNWRLKPAVLTMLPYLAAEQDNDPLLERVVALTLAGINEIPEGILIRLLPFLIHSKRIRKAAYDRFSKQKPTKRAPKWLAEHWSSLLKPERPATTMARLLIQKKVPISRAMKSIELDVTTPFAESILARLWVEIEAEDLKTQPFEESLQFIVTSGQAPEVRKLFLVWMLNTYIEHVQTLADIDIGKPHRQLLKAGIKILGSPNRSAWRDCNQTIRAWARHLHHEMMLKQHLDAVHGWGRSLFWRDYIRQIKGIEFHSPNNIVLIDFGEIAVVENLNKTAHCALFMKKDFWEIWQKKRWEGRPFRLPSPQFAMVRDQNWQSEMEKELQLNHQLEKEGWK